MSRRWTTLAATVAASARWRQIAQAYACPVCPAGPGYRCVTMNGNEKSEPHADRTRLASANDWKDPDEV